MSERFYSVWNFSHKTSGIFCISGQAISLRIKHHALEATSGFPFEAPQQTRVLTRAVHRIERLVVLAGSGWLTIAVLDWLQENSIPAVGLGQDGGVRWVIMPGPGGAYRSTLRRSQALAPYRPTGAEIAKYIVSETIHRRIDLLKDYADSIREHQSQRDFSDSAFRGAGETLRVRILPLVHAAETVERLRTLEADGSRIYWSAWSGIEAHFGPPSFARTAPAHARTFLGRVSNLTGSPRAATDVVNVALNLAFSLAAAEASIAIHGAGCDAHLAVLHSDQKTRESFTWDVVEVARPTAERLVLDLILHHEFRPKEIYFLRTGQVRLDQEFVAGLLPEWIPILRRAVEPVISHIVAILARSEKADRALHPARQPAPIVHTCRTCGAPIHRRGRTFCSYHCQQVWWRKQIQPTILAKAHEARMRVREKTGVDPTRTPEVEARRAITMSRAKKEEWARLSPEERRRRTAPASQARRAHKDKQGGDAMRRR